MKFSTDELMPFFEVRTGMSKYLDEVQAAFACNASGIWPLVAIDVQERDGVVFWRSQYDLQPVEF